MRILYHHRTQADGAEGIHIDEMVKAFRALGHEVRLLGPVASGGESRRRLAGRLRARLPQVAFELASVAYNVLDLLAMRREIRQFGANLLYKRHARFDLGALAAARRAGIPAVLEVNCVFSAKPYADFEPVRLAGLARWFERRALQAASVVAAVSTPLARQVKALSGREALVVPNGADPEWFDPARADAASVRQRHGLASRFVVGWCGVLRDWHGLELLLEAVAGLGKAHLLIVGDGPARPAVEARAAALGLTHRLVITGRVPHERMPDHVAAMDVCVVADERTGVASPMKLLEYMAMGRAAVAPRLENIEDVVHDGEDGLLFEPGAAGSLRETLSKLEGDSERRAALGHAARRKIVSSRNWRALAADLLHALPR